MVILTFYNDNKCVLEELDEEEKCTYEYDNKRITINSSYADTELNYDFIDDYLIIGDTRFYKDMKKAKDNQDKVVVHKKEVVGNRTKKRKIPDVSKMNALEAKRILEAEGFEVNIIYESNNYYQDGIIIKTYPKAGTIIETKNDKKAVVDLYVSSNDNDKKS